VFEADGKSAAGKNRLNAPGFQYRPASSSRLLGVLETGVQRTAPPKGPLAAAVAKVLFTREGQGDNARRRREHAMLRRHEGSTRA